MRFASTGIRAAWRSLRPDRTAGRRGFTLLEALVALGVLLAFASALGPYMFQARRLIDKAQGRVAAHVLLRSLLEVPLDRTDLSKAARDGETAGLRWRIVMQPMFAIQKAPPRDPNKNASAPPSAKPSDKPGAAEPDWMAFRVVASVSWAPGQLVTAETVRLGQVAQPKSE
jgi:prepilin-type N-terminal cleavage/methylation domain-containing protein